MKELFINIRKSLSKDIGFVLPENDISFNLSIFNKYKNNLPIKKTTINRK